MMKIILWEIKYLIKEKNHGKVEEVYVDQYYSFDLRNCPRKLRTKFAIDSEEAERE